MRAFTLLLLISAFFTESFACTQTIRLTDTFGDGWNGGAVTVSVNGTPVLTDITLASGSGPQDFTFAANNGDLINVTRSINGSYDYEMRVEILDNCGNTILATQEPLDAPGLDVIAVCNAPTVPGLATYNSPANGASGISTCGTTLTWTAPASTGCDAATSYDVYFGTAASPPFVTNTTSLDYCTGALSTSTTYYWKIVPKNAVGDAVGATTWSFTTSASACVPCTHTIRLTDTFGDGWNGGTVTVTVNGTPVLTNITIASGSGPEDHTFSAGSGSVINVTRTADGSFPTEMRIEVLDNCGNSILVTQEPSNSPGINCIGACGTPSVPDCASNPNPANAATGVYACGVTLSWTAPVNTGCNAANSYDLYFGTTPSPGLLTNTTSTTYAFASALADNTTYYWKVVPKNASGDATGCPIWSFTTGTSANPSYCLIGDATNYPAGGTNCAQMTGEVMNQTGCIWNRGTISFASPFDYTVNMYFGNNVGGADGCAFVFQNSPAGISSCGNSGGQLGAGGISNSVIIEFDTYDNDFPTHLYDMSEDHTAIEIDGNLQNGAPFCGPVQADPLDAFLDDGLIHALRVTWDPGTQDLAVYVDGSQRLVCNYDYINNVFGGNPNVFWGFTGSTGALTNQQYFCPVNIPVPVEMMDFSTECAMGKPVLTWYTASETNNNYFKIERSADGEFFEEIGHVNGAGNSNSTIMYQFIDESAPQSKNYYRLSQIDIDGTLTELGTSFNDCTEDQTLLDIVGFDTHGGTSLTVNFNTGFNGQHIIELYDLSGKLIEQNAIICLEGFNQADFCNLPSSGVYIIRISNSIAFKSGRIQL